jgi:hypothetical protein
MKSIERRKPCRHAMLTLQVKGITALWLRRKDQVF